MLLPNNMFMPNLKQALLSLVKLANLKWIWIKIPMEMSLLMSAAINKSWAGVKIKYCDIVMIVYFFYEIRNLFIYS